MKMPEMAKMMPDEGAARDYLRKGGVLRAFKGVSARWWR